MFLLLLAAAAFAQDWPQWRGPTRTGTAVNLIAPAAWPKQLHTEWRAAAGAGFSTPVASADSIFVFGRENEAETLGAFHRSTGKSQWKKSYPAPFQQNSHATRMGKGPHSTPVLYQDRIYTLGILGVLSCYQARTGELVWRKDFSGEIDTGNLFAGTAMSPLIEGGLLIVQAGDDRKGWIAAFDPATGARKWIWRGEGPGYSSPVAAEIGGVRQIITLTLNRAVALAASDGKLLWSLPFKDQWNENIVTPVVRADRVIFAGVRRGVFAVDVRRAGAQWIARPAWENSEFTMYMSSPVLDGAHLYGMTNKRKGQILCIDVQTGKVLWTTTGREGDNVSLVRAGAFLFLLNESGDLKISRLSPAKFEILAEYKVADGGTWPQPLVLGGKLLVRDQTGLTMYRFH